MTNIKGNLSELTPGLYEKEYDKRQFYQESNTVTKKKHMIIFSLNEVQRNHKPYSEDLLF
ncbi:CLUMA_CG006178, isoform A [Clunio marinus]|uniref:CLUMA_CG006178, isoform A n=1 Tax=Clunio marinus TaxID=568069 RepID=A0A1J1HX97_9DIPT|nr:CLUMA_CG006178, isoform A [Clunio marinus]